MKPPEAARPFIWLVIMIIGLEVFARYFFPLPLANEGVPADRNEYLLRSWPEYVSGSDHYEALMVYISNSQAVGSEYANSELIYPSLMRTSLRKSVPALRLENWAVSGMNAEQLELLTLQAVERKAKYMVVAVSLINFDNKLNYRFGKDRTDMSLMAGYLPFWTQLSDTFIGAYIDWDSKLSHAVELYSRVGRLRVRLLDELAARYERRWHRVLFGHQRIRSALRTIKEQASGHPPDQNAKIRKISNSKNVEHWEKSLRNNNLPRLNVLYAPLRQRLLDNEIELIWIWVPAGSNQYNQGAIEGQKSIVDKFCRQVVADGWSCYNLTEALPASDFLPSTFSSHLNRQGHQNQAALITPILQRAVH